MENYAPNSHKYKEARKNAEEREKLKPIANGKIKKKSKTHKFTDIFISEDASNVKSYIFADVFVPALKKLISDIVKDGVEMILYGSTGRGTRRDGFRADYVSYNRYSDGRGPSRPIDTRAKSNYSYNEVIFNSRGEAEEVLDRMDELIECYKVVRVADFYDLANLSCEFTDNDYGWTNIRNAEIVRTRDGGYTIKLPRAIPIER